MMRCLWLVSALFSATLVHAAELAPHAPGELLIKYRAGADIGRVHTAAKATRIEHLGNARWQRLALPADTTVTAALDYYRNQPEVEYAEPNYLAAKAETAPNDTDFNKQWALQNIKAPLAWDLATGSNNVIVAIVDTGIFYDHPDLTANVWVNATEIAGNSNVDDDGNGIIDDLHGVKYYNGLTSGDPRDDDTADWHGSHVSGIAGAVANNGKGISGVNWQVRLMGVKVLHGPSGTGYVSDIVKGIDYAINNGAHIINMSLTIGSYSQTLVEALVRADDAGVLVVSAAGNSGSNNDTTPFFPAAIRSANSIAVAALTSLDGLAGYSNYGRLTVDLAAPGGATSSDPLGIYSTVGTQNSDPATFHNYGWLAGTSMATPHVSGVAALLKAHTPALTHHQLKGRLLNSVRPLAVLADKTISGGTLDAYATLSGSEQPAVFRVVPAGAPVGDTLIITGVNFGTATGKVTVNGVDLPPPLSWSDSEVRVSMALNVPLLSYSRLKINDQGSSFPVRRLNRTPAVALAALPQQGNAPITVSFTATASDADGTITRYDWDPADGSGWQNTGTTNTLQYRYSAGGTYQAKVRVTDNDNGYTETTVTVTINGGSAASDSRCFIATAAWGSAMESEVVILRQFRDRHLLTNAVGRRFVDLYYTLSPPIADAVRATPWLRQAVRALLRPVVAVAGWLMRDAQAGSSQPQSLETTPAVRSELLIGFAAGITEAQARAIIRAEGGELREFHTTSHYGLAIFSGDTDALIGRLQRHPAVRYAEPHLAGSKPERPE